MILQLVTDTDYFVTVTAKQLAALAALPHSERVSYLDSCPSAAITSTDEVDITLVCDGWGSHQPEDEAEFQDEVVSLIKQEGEDLRDSLGAMLDGNQPG